MNNLDTLLVSKSGNVLVIGRKRKNQSVEIINAFQGDEAEDLYSRLITKKKGDNNAALS